MSSDIQRSFYESLDRALKKLPFESLAFKVSKKKVTLSKAGTPVADLSFVFLAKVSGIYLVARVFAGETYDALKALNLTSPGIVLSQDMLLISSLSEERKEFSGDLGGAVRLYAAMDFEAVCADLAARIAKFHLRVVGNFLDLSIDVVDDIVEYPNHYAFPVATAALSIRKHQLGEERFQSFLGRIQSKKFFGITAQSIAEAHARIRFA